MKKQKPIYKKETDTHNIIILSGEPEGQEATLIYTIKGDKDAA